MNTIFRLSLFFLIALNLLSNNVFAQNAPRSLAPGNKYFTAELIADRSNLLPPLEEKTPVGKIGVLLTLKEGWHTYWLNSGEAAFGTKISWQLPDGWKINPLNWPAPYKFIEKDQRTTYGYKEEVLIWTELFAPETQAINEDEKIKLSARINLLVCNDICVPGEQLIELELPYSKNHPEQGSPHSSLFEKYKKVSLIKDTSGKIKTWSGVLGAKTFAGLIYQGAESDKIQLFSYNHPEIKALDAQKRILADNSNLLTFEIPAQSLEKQQLCGILLDQDNIYEWTVKADSNNPNLFNLEILNTPGEKLGYHTIGAEVEKSPLPLPIKVNQAQTSLIIALLSAFLGGMILNLMPCVLPIISIKIMTFISQANQSRKEIWISCLTFAAGILSTFIALATLVIFLRSLGSNVGWGFQFQYPEFVFSLLIIVFFLSLAFFDLYTINLPFLQSANEAASKVKSGIAKHFFDGVLATALSTPCTAPFLGTALVFAFAQPPYITYLLFIAIGLGLAFPYVYFSSRPGLLRLLPPPGDWMYNFRQFLGFLLLGTVCWLLFILNDLTQSGALWSLVLLLVLYFCVWAVKKIMESSLSTSSKKIYQLSLLLLIVYVGYSNYHKIIARKGSNIVTASALIKWQEYSPQRLEEARNNKQAVFIDFTASWCITCKFNEYRIIETSETEAAIKKYNILPLKADWTDGNEKVSEALRSYGAEGVPLYVIISAKTQEPIILSTLPSQASLLDAFRVAAEGK